ncbi:o-succinylbenzoate synthase [Porphyromonas pogonae]|uniref:o-succinylbenzoate synthase n=1 Tax=Porphyromonas pogonae TaxID=867595 RepID=UPI002E7A70E3|nr:o-succinylbenzoate synthase [Porphyromonas pogonae]
MKRIVQGEVIPCELKFIRPAGTSRGVYTRRKVWYIRLLAEDGTIGIGESAPLPHLSCDDVPDYGDKLEYLVQDSIRNNGIDIDTLRDYPSMLFGLETAMRHLERSSFSLWDSPFAQGKEGITINGLIWMGDYEYMKAQILEKISNGYQCIKLKIGAIDFENELALLRMIRKDFDSKKIQLRVDANGAFAPIEAMDKLHRLSELELHSIEQPISQGQHGAMKDLCAHSELPIGFDEELIGINRREDKIRLLDELSPQYIILKPSLHGGFVGCKEWIDLAEAMGIGWWMTSALESNIGLNAIAQYTACFDNKLPQGLGTGKLFTTNVPVPLTIQGDSLWYIPGDAPSAADNILPL